MVYKDIVIMQQLMHRYNISEKEAMSIVRSYEATNNIKELAEIIFEAPKEVEKCKVCVQY